MVAGVALGPFTPGFHGDPAAIHQLAEFGVILLMFGVGLHFSFRDLWQVAASQSPAPLVQMASIAAAGYGSAPAWGFSTGGAWVFGLALRSRARSCSCAASWTTAGSTRPTARSRSAGSSSRTCDGRDPRAAAACSRRTTDVERALTVVARGRQGRCSSRADDARRPRVVPALLGRVVNTRSRELFVLVALTVAVGTALASAALFGVSLALGAFVAGVVVGESPFSHQIGADLLPFREAFAVIFFVSVGMLVEPALLVAHWDQRARSSSLLIVVGKAIVSGADRRSCLPLSGPHRARRRPPAAARSASSRSSSARRRWRWVCSTRASTR